MRRLPIALVALAAALGCKTRKAVDDSAVKTDETKAVLTGECDRGYEAAGTRAETIATSCACLKTRTKGKPGLAKLATAYCRDAKTYYDGLARLGHDEGRLPLTDSAGNGPDAKAAACGDTLAEARIEMLAEFVASACEKGTDQELANLINLPKPAAAGGCWRLVHQDAQGCIEAMPCIGRGPADVSALPASAASLAAWSGPRSVPEGTRVRLCNDTLTRMHGLKDPTRAMDPYNYPFSNYLSVGRSNPTMTFGAANCHGTAQAFAGGFLDQVPVDGGLSFHSDYVKQQCGTKAQAAYDEAGRQRGGVPTGADLKVNTGGHMINMVHEPTCDASDCGKVTFQTFDCAADKLETVIFHYNMCINCWAKRLEAAGWHEVPQTATYEALKPGCILTANDHSITTMFKNDGLCYFYESLSPYAAPQLNVSECQRLWDGFGRRWCPTAPFALNLENPR